MKSLLSRSLSLLALSGLLLASVVAAPGSAAATRSPSAPRNICSTISNSGASCLTGSTIQHYFVFEVRTAISTDTVIDRIDISWNLDNPSLFREGFEVVDNTRSVSNPRIVQMAGLQQRSAVVTGLNLRIPKGTRVGTRYELVGVNYFTTNNTSGSATTTFTLTGITGDTRLLNNTFTTTTNWAPPTCGSISLSQSSFPSAPATVTATPRITGAGGIPASSIPLQSGTYTWGDGGNTSSTTLGQQHTYTREGRYDINYSFADVYGNDGTCAAPATVTVGNPGAETCRAYATPTRLAVGEASSLRIELRQGNTVLTMPANYTVQWTATGGTLSNPRSFTPTVTYATSGSYRPIARLTRPGQADLECDSANTADITVEPPRVCKVILETQPVNNVLNSYAYLELTENGITTRSTAMPAGTVFNWSIAPAGASIAPANAARPLASYVNNGTSDVNVEITATVKRPSDAAPISCPTGGPTTTVVVPPPPGGATCSISANPSTGNTPYTSQLGFTISTSNNLSLNMIPGDTLSWSSDNSSKLDSTTADKPKLDVTTDGDTTVALRILRPDGSVRYNCNTIVKLNMGGGATCQVTANPNSGNSAYTSQLGFNISTSNSISLNMIPGDTVLWSHDNSSTISSNTSLTPKLNVTTDGNTKATLQILRPDGSERYKCSATLTLSTGGGGGNSCVLTGSPTSGNSAYTSNLSVRMSSGDSLNHGIPAGYSVRWSTGTIIQSNMPTNWGQPFGTLGSSTTTGANLHKNTLQVSADVDGQVRAEILNGTGGVTETCALNISKGSGGGGGCSAIYGCCPNGSAKSSPTDACGGTGTPITPVPVCPNGSPVPPGGSCGGGTPTMPFTVGKNAVRGYVGPGNSTDFVITANVPAANLQNARNDGAIYCSLQNSSVASQRLSVTFVDDMDAGLMQITAVNGNAIIPTNRLTHTVWDDATAQLRITATVSPNTTAHNAAVTNRVQGSWQLFTTCANNTSISSAPDIGNAQDTVYVIQPYMLTRSGGNTRFFNDANAYTAGNRGRSVDLGTAPIINRPTERNANAVVTGAGQVRFGTVLGPTSQLPGTNVPLTAATGNRTCSLCNSQFFSGISAASATAPASISMNNISDISSYALPGYTRVYGIALAGSTLNISSLSITEPTTIVVTGGNVRITGNITADSDSMLAIIVKDGDFSIGAGVTRIDAVLAGCSGAGGRILGDYSTAQLHINGSVYADMENIVRNRRYADDPLVDGGNIVVRFDNRTLSNTPPLLARYCSGELWRQVQYTR